LVASEVETGIESFFYNKHIFYYHNNHFTRRTSKEDQITMKHMS
jgi:hypothetical protein